MHPDAAALTVISSFPNPSIGNPYLKLLYQHLAQQNIRYEKSGYFGKSWLLENRKKVDYLHFHWISEYQNNRNGQTSLLMTLIFVAKIWFARTLGYRVIWTMHNLFPHNKEARFKEWLCRLLFIHSMSMIFINFEDARNDLGRLFFRWRRIFLIPHGSYRPVYPIIPSRQEARQALNIPDDDYVFFLFGGISPYKGAHKAIAAFKLVQQPQARLIIMGQCLSDKYHDELTTQAAADSRITLLLSKEDVTDEQVLLWMAAIDCVVAPYERIYTSGVLYLAATFEKPIIAPRQGVFAGLETLPFIINYDETETADIKTLCTKLNEALGKDTATVQESARAFADRHDWQIISMHVARILQTYARPYCNRSVGTPSSDTN